MIKYSKWQQYSIPIILLLVILLSGSCAKESPAQQTPSTASPVVTSFVTPTTSPPVVELSPTSTQAPPSYTYNIVNVYPHDRKAFTEGLVLDNGVLYESTGLNGHSSLRQEDLKTGNVQRIYELPAQYFGEGIAINNDSIVQLTWQSHIGFVYNKSDFSLLQTFDYPTEGWGITFDGSRYIMSDGTSHLIFLDKDTLQVTGQITVQDQSNPITELNELEYANGLVYANVWETDEIAIINPQDGQVTGWIDLTGILETQGFNGQVDVLNGIAYDTASGNLLVTGKYWPYLFEITLRKD